VWWALHEEAVSRNHECEDLDDLVEEFAEGYLTTSIRGSPSIPNSARSMSSWRGHRLEVGECPFILWSYLGAWAGRLLWRASTWTDWQKANTAIRALSGPLAALHIN
jgi:hypothetical protein